MMNMKAGDRVLLIAGWFFHVNKVLDGFFCEQT